MSVSDKNAEDVSCPGSDKESLHAKLLSKNAEQRRKQMAEHLFHSSGNKPNESLCCICENCGYVFYRKDDSEDFVCPKCQMRHHFEPAEEVSSLGKGDTDPKRFLKLMLKDKASLRKAQAGARIKPLTADTHQDDAKNQASLAMGSDEYKEYLRDLKENDPASHAAQVEKEAADPSQALYSIPEEEDPAQADDAVLDEQNQRLMDRKAQISLTKLEIHDSVVSDLTRAARLTKTTADDEAVADLSEDNPVLRDETVSSDDYEQELEDFLHLP